MRITKKVREEAARVCSIAASSGDIHRFYGNIVLEIDASLSAWDLASDALQAAFSRGGHGETLERAYDAEAEAMLRTGWCP